MTSKGSKADEDQDIPGTQEELKRIYEECKNKEVVSGLDIQPPPSISAESFLNKADSEEPRKYTAEEVFVANDDLNCPSVTLPGDIQMDIVPMDAILDVFVEKYEEHGQKVSHYDAYFDQSKKVVVLVVYYADKEFSV